MTDPLHSLQGLLQSIHFVCVVWMTAVIWVIQLIVYPGFLSVESSRFANFHRLHTSRITWIVAPPMLLQLGTSVLRVWPGDSHDPLNWIQLGLALALFISTFAFSVPEHNRLQHGADEPAARSLIRTNWIRTALWSVDFILVLVQLTCASAS